MLSTEQPSTGPYMPASRSPLPLQNNSRNFSHRYSSATTSSSSLSSSAASYTARSQQNPHAMKPQHIWIVTGPAGCGKTTVAQGLAKELHIPYIEGDDVCTHQLISRHLLNTRNQYSNCLRSTTPSLTRRK